MAHVSNLAKALADAAAAAASGSDADAAAGHVLALRGADKSVNALLTPPDSLSPELVARANLACATTPPPMNIAHHDVEVRDVEVRDVEVRDADADVDEDVHDQGPSGGVPLSKGALSGLDASAAITPSLLAQDYLPGIMLGNGPRPIRYVMGELTHSVPGFSRIAPAKARRLVVAALESRSGGGRAGNVAFFKTGWGRWDAHVIGQPRDSGIGSFPKDGHSSPPRSEYSSYAMSNNDSGVHAVLPHARHFGANHRGRDHRSGGSWTASSIREEDEDMDMLEHEADKMSLDGVSELPSEDEASIPADDEDDATDDEDDWAAAGPAALRKASLPSPNAPRWIYKAYQIPKRRPSREWSRRPSTNSLRPPLGAASLPLFARGYSLDQQKRSGVEPAAATPEEQAAVAALLSLGASM